jgi:threonine dehydratase
MLGKIDLIGFREAERGLSTVVKKTPLELNVNFSEEYAANVYFKREDQQVVRSYKLRGAYNKLSHIAKSHKNIEIVCASAGNHAQGVALSCQLLGMKGTVFMPSTTPKQKVKQVYHFGKKNVDVVLMGDTFDDAYREAIVYAENNQYPFIHPFDDIKVVEGQGTVGLEILNQVDVEIDYLFLPVGGGGLAAGISTVFSVLSPSTKIIGVEPTGAPSMSESIKLNQRVKLKKFDKFVDGASVGQVGALNFEICKKKIDEMLLVPEGEACATLLKLYNEEAIVVEPAGALSVAALRQKKHEIQGKNVVCVISGGNNDITRTEEIKERALFYEGLKHYFLVKFPQRPGALKDFVSNVLGPDDDITYFQFSKKNNRENGPAVVGIEVISNDGYIELIKRMKSFGIEFQYLYENQLWFDQLVSMN